MDPYNVVRPGKLKIKNENSAKKVTKKRRHKARGESLLHKDAKAHGGWWTISNIKDISGSISIEFTSAQNKPDDIPLGILGPHSLLTTAYVTAMDDGALRLGPPRPYGEPPVQEEMFTVVKLSESQFAFKSGYGKYLGIAPGKNGLLVATADAIGDLEHIDPIFQDGKMALLGANGKFLTFDEDSAEGDIFFASEKAQENEMIIVG
ncbi:unnamed protein product [Protopolystoma xenopodis]|uniref:Uncharacterized protein n=1 Tax=Protopolystoma xenopodis TaxID=117903 RepID=A0A448WZL7_9PLAT|nr:unnamed protein product [Protopolystoma xenopodis]